MFTEGCKANCKKNKTCKIDEFYDITPQIFDNVYGVWYQCVSLFELVLMHSVVFFQNRFVVKQCRNCYFGQNALAQKMTTLNNLFWYLMKLMDRLLGDDTLDVTGSEIDSLLGDFFRNCHYLVSTAD